MSNQHLDFNKISQEEMVPIEDVENAWTMVATAMYKSSASLPNTNEKMEAAIRAILKRQKGNK